MPKIKHTTLIFSDLSQLNEIPSEYLEPYLIKFFEYIIESVGGGWKKPHEAKQELKGIESFVSLFGGIHSRIATQNQYYNIKNLPDETFLEICKKVCAVKSYLVNLIQRGLTPQEEINLLHGLADYVMSEPATEERLKSMDYLFGLNFLID